MPVRRTLIALRSSLVFSSLLGPFFLWQVNGLLPQDVFYFLALGWLLIVADTLLSFVRPKASCYGGLALALLGLGASLPQSAHYAFIEEGALLPSFTFIAGSGALVLILVLAPLHLYLESRAAAGPK